MGRKRGREEEMEVDRPSNPALSFSDLCTPLPSPLWKQLCAGKVGVALGLRDEGRLEGVWG